MARELVVFSSAQLRQAHQWGSILASLQLRLSGIGPNRLRPWWSHHYQSGAILLDTLFEWVPAFGFMIVSSSPSSSTISLSVAWMSRAVVSLTTFLFIFAKAPGYFSLNDWGNRNDSRGILSSSFPWNVFLITSNLQRKEKWMENGGIYAGEGGASQLRNQLSFISHFWLDGPLLRRRSFFLLLNKSVLSVHIERRLVIILPIYKLPFW